MIITPFKIRVSDESLEDLNRRLQRTRWPDTITEGWEYGTNLVYLQELLSYWQAGFDWRKQEQRLNSFPQFLAELSGIRIHFIHQRSPHANAVPLILTHGWPGSFIEMLGLLPLLKDRFHVVVPSLPGYGFSEKPRERDFHPRRFASLWAELMSALDYPRFVAQGGDWGATVSTWLALDFPARIAGVHLNYIPGSYKPFLPELSRKGREYGGTGDASVSASAQILSKAERRFLKEQEEWILDEGGYGHIQGTRPQTVAFGLNDSPAGLAAWIVEKLRSWSDCGGDVEKRFSKDEILTNIQIYWHTETIHSSMRVYYEAKKMPLQFQDGQRVAAPCAVARFPGEAPMPPREWVERGYQVVRWTEMSAGAHFAAWEEPELLAADLIDFAETLQV